MALDIKDRETERLAAEVAGMTGESKTRAIRTALEERRARLAYQVVRPRRAEAKLRFLEREVWPLVPEGELGRRLTREEEQALLGLGPAGA